MKQRRSDKWIMCCIAYILSFILIIPSGIGITTVESEAASYHIIGNEKWQWPMSNWYLIGGCYGGVDPYGGRHCGIDISRHIGYNDSTVTAAQTGKIIRIENGCKKTENESGKCSKKNCNNCTARGNCVTILTTCSNGERYVHLYMHLLPDSIPSTLKVGDTVNKGTKIGIAGNSGTSSGVHLHFEVHRFPASDNSSESKVLNVVDTKLASGYKQYVIDPLSVLDFASKPGNQIKATEKSGACCKSYVAKHLDNEKPVITNVKVLATSFSGYQVWCDVTTTLVLSGLLFLLGQMQMVRTI